MYISFVLFNVCGLVSECTHNTECGKCICRIQMIICTSVATISHLLQLQVT
jgi:hypothetical protein